MKVVKKKDDRKTYLINPSFQLTIVGIFIGISLVVNIIYFISMNFSFEEFFALGKELGLPQNSQFFKFISHQKDKFTNIFLASLFVCYKINKSIIIVRAKVFWGLPFFSII